MVLSVRPGITGAASVIYRYEEALLAGEDRETSLHSGNYAIQTGD